MRRAMIRAASLLFLLPAACVTDGDEEFLDGGTINIPLEGVCVDGCNVLEQCGECDTNEFGECVEREQCIYNCDQNRDYERFVCLIDQGAACGATAQSCLDSSGVTGCHQACGNLEACEICLTNEAGACLTVQACLSRCEDPAEADAFNCVNNLQACDESAVEACFGGSGLDLGDDACADGCEALDACELGLADENENALSPQECVAECRGAAQIIDADRATCLTGVQACNQDAIDACLSGEGPIGDDDCAKGCLALDACELCIPDENEECQSPAQCAAACRAGEGIDATQALCLENLNGCGEAAINACLDIEEPAAPDCAVYCQREVECAALPAEEQDAALATCNTECAAADDAALRTCYVEAADCAAAEACQPE